MILMVEEILEAFLTTSKVTNPSEKQQPSRCRSASPRCSVLNQKGAQDDTISNLRSEKANLRRDLFCAQVSRRSLLRKFSEMRSVYYRQLQQLKSKFDNVKHLHPEISNTCAQHLFDASSINFFDPQQFIDDANEDIAKDEKARTASSAQQGALLLEKNKIYYFY